MRALILLIAAGAACAGLAAAPALAGSTNPAILLDQVGAPAAKGSVGVPDASPRRPAGGVAVAPVPAGPAGSSKARVSQPKAVLDRCEAILKGRAPPVEGLDCSDGQLARLREQVAAEAAGRASQSVDVDSLAKDLKALGRAPDQTDPATGAPAVAILTPGQ